TRLWDHAPILPLTRKARAIPLWALTGAVSSHPSLSIRTAGLYAGTWFLGLRGPTGLTKKGDRRMATMRMHSRRTFLAGAAGTAAMTLLAACAPPAPATSG